jgi:hypothetical protein
VSSGLIDRVVAGLGRRLLEVPVGFKWFSAGLLDGSICFGGEESAGASFLRRDGSVWTTDKDGIILGLLAAEITAVTGKDPGRHYLDLAARYGAPHYVRIDAPASPAEKAAFKQLTAERVSAATLAGEPIVAKPDARRRQRCADRRAQGGHRKRLVRRPALGHRGYLQDLRRELQERGTPATGRGRGEGDRVEGAGGVRARCKRRKCLDGNGELVCAGQERAARIALQGAQSWALGVCFSGGGRSADCRHAKMSGLFSAHNE